MATLLAWHTVALDNVRNHLQVDMNPEPECGWFQRRLTRGGPFVPARIYIDSEIDDETGELVSDEKLCCQVNGRSADPFTQWEWLAASPITKADYDYLSKAIAWSQEFAPHEPMANPRKPVDWSKTPIPTFTKGQ
ncbi:MAG: hypothetical protein ABJA10_02715 [Aestuariivirga sp.]